MGRRRTPIKRNWEKNMVYLYQLPRAKCAPSISATALKLETWLRMANVEYRNVECGFWTRSLKGQTPFIELNGREIADSNTAISLLATIFRAQLDKHLYEIDLACARAFASMLENNLSWVVLHIRTSHVKEILGERGLGGNMSRLAQSFSPFFAWIIGRQMQKRLLAQGVGKNSLSENIEMAKKDLHALSMFMNKKKYLTGMRPSSADASIFAHLVQVWYVPIHTTPLKQYMASECPNLVDYMERVKAEFWPDWDEATTTLSLDTKK